MQATGPADLDNRAVITVTLPADAKLIFEGKPTSSSAEMRWFVSPPLQPGRAYQYELRAEVLRNGATQVLTRNIVVRRGEETRVVMDFSSPEVATR
jgi:uncharacterized protein (TIGR03000 family)